ncbi:MAG: hypothetical protein EBE86_022840 [Hormoscilla sp. GUM202]|nr:hypothetical protein [Hormoscilla sp. GUM202]
MWQRLLRPLTLGIGGLLGSAIALWGLGKMLTGIWQQQTFANLCYRIAIATVDPRAS